MSPRHQIPGRGRPNVGRRPRRRVGRGSAGFTMVEMLAVMAVIAILVGLVVGGVQVAQRQASRGRAIADLQRITTAIEDFRAEHGFYPPTRPKETSFDDALVFWLVYEPADEGHPPHLEIKSEDVGVEIADIADDGEMKDLRLIDPWGQPWRYKRLDKLAPRSGTSFRVEGRWDPVELDDGSGDGEKYQERNADTFDLYSVGPDGLLGTADDITNWSHAS